VVLLVVLHLHALLVVLGVLLLLLPRVREVLLSLHPTPKTPPSDTTCCCCCCPRWSVGGTD